MIFTVKHAGDEKGLLIAVLIPIVFLIAAFVLLWLGKKKNSDRLKKYAEGSFEFFIFYTFPSLFINILTFYLDSYFYFESAWYFLSIPFLIYFGYIFHKKVKIIYKRIAANYENEYPNLNSE